MILAAFPRSGYAPLTASGVVEAPEPEPEPPAPPEPWIAHPGIFEGEGINQLLGDGDRLYIAHGTSWTKGDYNLAWVDLTAGEPVTGPLIPSEGFETVRKVADTIYFPWVDPMGPWGEPQGYTYSDGAGGWATKLMFPAYHVLDMREHDGDLFACGAGPYEGAEHAQVWRSRDGGTTWERSLVLPGTASTVRCYSFLPTGNGLWVIPRQAVDSRPHRLEGDVWVPHDGIVSHAPLWPWDMIFLRSAKVVTDGRVAYGAHGAFDGEVITGQNHYEVYPAWADSTHVYALLPSTGKIVRTAHIPVGTTRIEWEDWLTLPVGLGNRITTAATLHDGWVYVAGGGGRIWRYPPPA